MFEEMIPQTFQNVVTLTYISASSMIPKHNKYKENLTQTYCSQIVGGQNENIEYRETELTQQNSWLCSRRQGKNVV